MIASAQDRGIGDGWSVTRKANRRPIYEEVQVFGEPEPYRLFVAWSYDDDPDLERAGRRLLWERTGDGVARWRPPLDVGTV